MPETVAAQDAVPVTCQPPADPEFQIPDHAIDRLAKFLLPRFLADQEEPQDSHICRNTNQQL